ncbi:DUF732 domain-containing protein [Mycobacterium helveticum]|uniref:DUF732 domain-containing protein n=1 Tax=Mycobacterium helveticum TaxID=2592811 RepID=A0A557XEB8_9MYCO|nr:DUF732 domain-containing protein [Mycobacterium helveticum]TVS83927.1 DUF732 domain-containing protein [Mycobacterium helveticum]TVS84402.1 DUF732 domain-containing protein [Mycobacterium helveticum]
MTHSRTRTPQRGRPLSVGLALTVALLGPAGIAAPAAHADAIDNAFLSAVQAKGINFPSAQAAIIAGHEVCDELDLGRQKSDVASEVMSNSRLDGYHAGFFVGASIAAFCPRNHAAP